MILLYLPQDIKLFGNIKRDMRPLFLHHTGFLAIKSDTQILGILNILSGKFDANAGKLGVKTYKTL